MVEFSSTVLSARRARICAISNKYDNESFIDNKQLLSFMTIKNVLLILEIMSLQSAP